MPSLASNGVTLEFDTFGDPSAPPVLLVMGLGAQMIFWHELFCEQLATRGRYVIRFDNRDCGRSTKLDDCGLPDVARVFGALASGGRPDVPYLLADMADDTAGLLDGLGIDSAHVVGASMGGMIAQTLALRRPERVRSLVSIMSSTGRPGLPGPTPEAQRILFTPPPSDRAGVIEHAVDTWRTIGSPGFPFDEAAIRERAGRAFDRGFCPQGTARQFAAIVASGSRHEALCELSIPSLVIHGDADPLIPFECGRDTAAAIPGAEWLLVEGMGHDLPEPVWPLLLDAIDRHTAEGAG